MQLLPIFRVDYIFIKYQFLFFTGDLPDNSKIEFDVS